MASTNDTRGAPCLSDCNVHYIVCCRTGSLAGKKKSEGGGGGGGGGSKEWALIKISIVKVWWMHNPNARQFLASTKITYIQIV